MGDLDSLLNSLQQRLDEIPSTTNPLARGLCFGCKKDIVGRMMDAMGHKYHPECWKCHECHKILATTGFYESEGKGYCEDCHNEKFLPKCYACKQPIADSYAAALDKQYHHHCLRCHSCGKSLNQGKFYNKNNLPHCENCS